MEFVYNEQIKAMCEEVLPLAESFQKIAKKYGYESISTIDVAADDYIRFTVSHEDWDMTKIGDEPAKIRWNYSEVVLPKASGRE